MSKLIKGLVKIITTGCRGKIPNPIILLDISPNIPYNCPVLHKWERHIK